jgi:hypothetical protein
MESLQRVYSPHDRSPALERAEGTGQTSKGSVDAAASAQLSRGRSNDGRRLAGGMGVSQSTEKVDDAVARSSTGLWRRPKKKPWGFKVSLKGYNPWTESNRADMLGA